MFTIVLVTPQIPQNTGNIGRLCAANNAQLHLVGALGFELTDRYLKRAGLDYWPYLSWKHFHDVDAYMSKIQSERCHLLTTKTTTPYTTRTFQAADYLIFGSETSGIPAEYRDMFQSSCCTIPMGSKHVRSLNLSNAVSIVLYEAIRQNAIIN